MNIYNIKLISKKFKNVFFISILVLPLLYILTAGIYTTMYKDFPVFNKMSGYSILKAIIDDDLEILTNLPILLLIVSMIKTRGGYFEKIRFKNKSKIFSYNLQQFILICIIFTFLEIGCLSIFCKIFMPVKEFEWHSSVEVLKVIFGDIQIGKKINPKINSGIFLIVLYLILLLRNITISSIFMSVLIYFNRAFSMGLVIGLSFISFREIKLIQGFYYIKYLDIINLKVLAFKIIILTGVMLVSIGIYRGLFLNVEEIKKVR